ncbi:MAG: PEP-CTERM sorting domain-containing protein [Verrucomicrobiota bacterium]
MKAPKFALLAALLTGLAAVPAAKAAVITAVGVDTTTGANWRTTTVSKPYDVNGDKVYGTDGYLALATGGSGNTAVTAASAVAAGTQGGKTTSASLPSWATFAAIDFGRQWNWYNTALSANNFNDPTLTPGPSVANIVSGLSYANTGLVVVGPRDYFTLTLGAATPANFRLGLINNGVGSGMTSITLTSGTDTATQAVGSPANDNVMRYVFFDLQNAASKTFTITITGNPGNQGLSGLSFDVVPEPSTWALLAFSLTSVMVLRRRRRA